jgi:hypothetical protein
MLSRYAFALAFATVLAPGCGNGQPGDPCPIDDGLYQCHRAIVEEHLDIGQACTVITVDDGQPCRTGVGVCAAGHCVEPIGTPETCGAGGENPSGVCAADAECHGFNLCVDYSCPYPGQDVCRVLPKPDGTRCNDGMACLHGSCCLPVPATSCAGSSTGNPCPAIEDCTVGDCAEDGTCHFTRSPVGADCHTKAGDAGKCIQPVGDVVPRCAPLM